MIDKFKWYLAVHFAILGFLAACLVSLGSGSLNLPLLIGTVAIISLVLTDWLGWFKLHRYLGYVGMILGAGLALSDFLASETTRLNSIAAMLVYAEIVLYLQEKNQRIFEQLGVFILLELVVAALITNNILFGLLLIPVLAISLSTLILFTHYTALLNEGRNPIKRRLNLEYLFDIFLNRNPDKKNDPSKLIALTPVTSPEWSKQLRYSSWLVQATPLAFSVLVFALLFFYLLPRTNAGSYNVPSLSKPVVGFSERMDLNQFGNVLTSNQLVMRVSFRDMKTKEPYELQQAPYLRGVVLEDYFSNRGRTGTWMQRREVSHVPLRDLPAENSVNPAYRERGDWVAVRFSLEKTLSPSLFCVAPTCAISAQGFRPHFIPEDWRIHSQDLIGDPASRKIGYTIGTGQFRNGLEHALVPEATHFFNNNYAQRINYSGLTPSRMIALTRIELQMFPGLIALRDRILKQNPDDTKTTVGSALAMESFFSSGTEYQYTLDLTAPRDSQLDAVEDFIVNHKKGHCQYFASALALILRSRGTPARIVVGFRPNEYNELGHFFTVRQNDAHSWVEAYFSREQLLESKLFAPEDVNSGGWLRLDPTPPSEESNSGGVLRRRRTTPDFFQEMWSRNVLELNQLQQGSTIYGSLGQNGNNPYANSVEWLKTLFTSAQASEMDDSQTEVAEWFSLPVAAWIIGLGSVIAVVWWTFFSQIKKFMPTLSPLRPTHDRLPAALQFYERCLRILARLGFRRLPNQTPAEVTQQASIWLATERHLPQAGTWLQQLTDTYYRLRFGMQGTNDSAGANHTSVEQLADDFQKATKDLKPNRHKPLK